MNAELQIIKTYGPYVFAALLGILLMFHWLKDAQSAVIGWLSKLVGRKLEEDAERYRHQLSKDMEAYKNDLSRSLNVERIKSEVRRAVAEKLLYRRLEALHEVHLELSNFPSWVTSIVRFANEQQRGAEFMEKMERFGGVMDRNGLYFPSAFKRDYRHLASILFELIGEWHAGAVLDANDPRLPAALQIAADLQLRIEDKHRTLPDEISGLMTENPPRAIPAAADPEDDPIAAP